jgi:hypothetical protein
MTPPMIAETGVKFSTVFPPGADQVWSKPLNPRAAKEDWQ